MIGRVACHIAHLLSAGSLLLGPLGSLVWADGGTLRLSQDAGGYQIVVFTDPAPLRAGPVDLSVWVQQSDNGALVDASEIAVTATNATTKNEIIERATRDAATNKLLQAARLELPIGGQWQFDISVRPTAEGGKVKSTTKRFTVSFEVDVADRLPRWRELAAWILWPIVPIGLFGTHLILSRRARRAPRDLDGAPD